MTTPAFPEPVVASGRDTSSVPNFINRDGNGVFVNCAKLLEDVSFQIFVDRLFSQGARFSGLDYANFQKLLYQPQAARGAGGLIRLAAEIVVFPPQRKALYKGVRLMDNAARAEYMFEPVFLEVSYQEPQYGEPDASGSRPIIGYQDKTRQEPTQLNIDEFIADMWTKGVRFGIDVPVVQRAIAANKADRLVIAFELKPKPGRDAELHEECEGLHRDDSPLITAGKADLRRFKNRFPQIAGGQRMMKKIPYQLGEPGFKVSGDPVPPDAPKDLDLAVVAGPGTKIELIQGVAYIVAVADGFIAIDVDSNQISVTEKIESKGGISARTTGDLTLSVEEFVEHGEVQEGREVAGKHMKFTSPVYGKLLSDGGRIELEDNLSGGSAISKNGSINIKKRASNASIEAIGGTVHVHYAENSTIIGDTVSIEHAINCEVMAKQLNVGLAQGCFLAARSADIGTSGDRKGSATTVSVLIPDSAEAQRQASALTSAIAEFDRLILAKTAEMDKFKANPEFAKFLSIGQMVRAGKIKVSPALEQNFRLLQNKYAGALKVLDKLNHEKQDIKASADSKRQELAQLKQAQTAAAAGRGCTIREVVGETCVQQLRTNLALSHFSGSSGNELGKTLRAAAATPVRIFLDDKGNVDWHFAVSP